MREPGCQHCDGLWERYRVSVMEYTRLDSKMKLAQLRYEQEIESLKTKLSDAEKERDVVRRLIIEHEQDAHPGARLTVFD
jgi:hypothetical protein